MTRPTQLLALSHVSFEPPGSQPILRDVSLTIGVGDFITLIGPNGAGKSTLLKLIVGLLQPSSGTLTRSQDLRMGYIPQRLQLNEMMPLTVKNFLQTSPRTIDLEAIETQLEITSLLPKSMHDLSGGEFQRVLLARALLQKPNLLIMDEPAQGLDLAGQDHFYKLIHDLKDQKGLAMILVSHDLHFVHRASDTVICLNHHICCMGRPSEVRDSLEFKALFPHATGQEVLPYHHDHACSHEEHTHG
jgi:zinc transport system ATP-binding protein